MKKLGLLCLLVLGTLATAHNNGSHHHNDTIIQNVRIDYVRELALAQADHHGFAEYFAAIGGRVNFRGPGPVFVTTRIGDQDYSAVADKNGFYSFLVWVNGSEFIVDAWTTHGHHASDHTNRQKKSIKYFIGQ